MQEEIVSGKKFRRLIDAATDKWQRISFWSKASDCVMEDKNGNETTVENEIQNIRDAIQNQNEFNNKLLVYNANSDSYQGYVNGQWKDVVYAGLKWDGYLIKDGTIIENSPSGGFNIDAPNYNFGDSSNKTTLPNYKYGTVINKTSSYIEITPYFEKYGIACLRTQNMIDLSKYKKCIINCDVQSAYSHDDQDFSDVRIYISKGSGNFTTFGNLTDIQYWTRPIKTWYGVESQSYSGYPTLYESFDFTSTTGKYYLYIIVTQKTKYNAGIKIYDLKLE